MQAPGRRQFDPGSIKIAALVDFVGGGGRMGLIHQPAQRLRLRGNARLLGASEKIGLPMKVAVLDDYHRVFDADPAIERLRRRTGVDVFTEKITSLEKLKDYPVLIALRERTRFDAAFFERLPRLELIAQTGNHAYHVDVDAATRAGVLVGMASSDVQAMGGRALHDRAHLRPDARGDAPHPADRPGDAPRRMALLRRPHAERQEARHPRARPHRARSLLAQAFGMQVLAWGPTLTAERAAKSGATFMELDALLQAADIVTVQLKPDESRGLLDERRLCLMRPHAVLINTARGAIVDEAALARILQEARLRSRARRLRRRAARPDSPLRRSTTSC